MTVGTSFGLASANQLVMVGSVAAAPLAVVAASAFAIGGAVMLIKSLSWDR